MMSFILFLVLAFSSVFVAAQQDLMVVCYAAIPDGVDGETVCGAQRRVLHALRGPEQNRRHLGISCTNYCAGWGSDSLCMEYKCDLPTVGRNCESTDLIPATDTTVEIASTEGLKDEAHKHFLSIGANSKSDECKKIMKSVSCMCVDQNVVMSPKPDYID